MTSIDTGQRSVDLVRTRGRERDHADASPERSLPGGSGCCPGALGRRHAGGSARTCAIVSPGRRSSELPLRHSCELVAIGPGSEDRGGRLGCGELAHRCDCDLSGG